MQEVSVPALSIDHFRPLVGEEVYDRFIAEAYTARDAIGGRTIWNMNSTAAGGGVAECCRRSWRRCAVSTSTRAGS